MDEHLLKGKEGKPSELHVGLHKESALLWLCLVVHNLIAGPLASVPESVMTPFCISHQAAVRSQPRSPSSYRATPFSTRFSSFLLTILTRFEQRDPVASGGLQNGGDVCSEVREHPRGQCQEEKAPRVLFPAPPRGQSEPREGLLASAGGAECTVAPTGLHLPAVVKVLLDWCEGIRHTGLVAQCVCGPGPLEKESCLGALPYPSVQGSP